MTISDGPGVTTNNDIMAMNAFSALADVSVGNDICSSAVDPTAITLQSWHINDSAEVPYLSLVATLGVVGLVTAYLVFWRRHEAMDGS